MRTKIIFYLLISTHIFGQNSKTVYVNDTHAYYKIKDDFNNSQIICDITLNPDSTFEFYSRPNLSCFTWRSYTGKWETKNDTIIFYDQYEVKEDDVRFFYNRTSEEFYSIRFTTDKNATLTNRNIKIEIGYDYDAKIEDLEKEYTMASNGFVRIPFKEIPHIDKVANLRIEYNLNPSQRRYGYITENRTINVRYGSVPNIIDVEFVETPATETVYRATKFLKKGKKIEFISSLRTKTKMKDYYDTIEFETDYKLQN